MHRFVAGICRMELTLTPQGPWLVRAEQGKSPITALKTPDGAPLLPASSLKGVLRSTAERILRTVDSRSDPGRVPLADDPFVHDKQELSNRPVRSQVADSELLEWNKVQHAYEADELQPQQIYQHLTPATQLFGATIHAGLLTLTDAVARSNQTTQRSHVAIDRFTGGVGEGPFVEELAADRQPLSTTLTVTNFALWQIGLLGLVFQEINRGYVAFGGGTHKGQGQFRVQVANVLFEYPAAAYQVPAGVVSAQARLASGAWQALTHDLPAAVGNIEAERILLEDISPDTIPAHDWRAADIRRITLNEQQQIHTLFAEAVEKAWVPWLDEVLR